MNRDVTPAGRSVAENTTDRQDPELTELYAELAEAASSSHAAKRAAQEKPSDSASKKFQDLDQQFETIIARINKLLR